jgi:hypothetical protein
VPICPPQIPHDVTWARPRAAAVGSQRLTAWAMELRNRTLRIKLYLYYIPGAHGSVVVKALCYKPDGRAFETRWGEWILSNKTNKQTPWSESESELYRPSDCRLLAKWLPTFADKGCHVVSVTGPYGRIIDFLDRSRYFPIKKLLSCSHESEWTPFQTHYIFFLVVPGIEPGPPDL